MRRPFIAGNWKMNLDRSAGAALARAVAEFGGIYTTHIRDESSRRAWQTSVLEAIQVGEQAGLPVQVSHLESHF